MLLRIENGAIINMAHVAVIIAAYKTEEEAYRLEARLDHPSSFCEITGECEKEFAEFAVKDIASEWSAGTRLYDVRESRRRFNENWHYDDVLYQGG